MMNDEGFEGRKKDTFLKEKNLVLTGAVLASILVLSIAALSPLQGGFAADSMYGNNNSKINSGNSNNNTITNWYNHNNKTMASWLPQPNDDSVVLEATASNALFEPAAGLTNVFGPGGLFPFAEVFDCADALTCGVSAGEGAMFMGTFEEGNMNELTGYTATYMSPITYGPHQIAGHMYKIELTDTVWNSSDAAMPTMPAEFTTAVNNVGFNQIQHGASLIDRSDVPQLYDHAFLYGHAKVVDITNGNNTIVAEDIFTHVMVAHVMDEDAFYRNLHAEAMSPTMVFIFTVNIPNDTELPGVGKLSAEQAQSFTPSESDPGLTNPPPFDYPIEKPAPANGTIRAPDPQSAIWPVANPNQPLLFNFLVYQDTRVSLKSMDEMVNENDTQIAAINVDSKIEVIAISKGRVIVVDGEGFMSDSVMTVKINGAAITPTRTHTDSNGEFVTMLRMPVDAIGRTLTISAEDDSGRQAEDTLKVQ